MRNGRTFLFLALTAVLGLAGCERWCERTYGVPANNCGCALRCRSPVVRRFPTTRCSRSRALRPPVAGRPIDLRGRYAMTF